jgi:serine/threonine protein kinase
MNSSEYLQIGYKIAGHYEIIKVLGQGGFGIVYLVKDIERLDEQCIIKELFVKEFSYRNRGSNSISNKKMAEKTFKKIKEDVKEEINILKRIKNKNVVKAYGYFEGNDTIYSIMEYIDGNNLEKYSYMSEDEAKELLRQLINGLKEIHSRGIIHRDIKPNNIIRTSSGLYKIIDFTTSKTYSTNKTNITGLISKGYTPPELEQTKAIIGNDYEVFIKFPTITAG